MRTKINISVLLMISVLFYSSCEEEKPVRQKKQFSVENKTEQNKEETSILPVEETVPKSYEITSSQFKDLGMELGTAEIATVNQSITAAGYIEVPKEGKAEVRAIIGGYLQSTPLLPGDYVTKGQFLISLENLEYIQLQRDYLQARDELDYLRAVYERKTILAEEQITSLSSKQEAESEFNSALANYQGLRKMLKLINIDPDKIQPENITSRINLYSPINGYLTRVNAIEGSFAEQTDVIFEIINTDHLHLELKVYEKDILKVKKGQKISFRIPETNSDIFSGTVFLVGKTIEGADKTVAVHCHISEDFNLPVIVGMYVEAEIHYASGEVCCLPSDSFIREEGEYFIFIEKSFSDDKYVFDKVKVEVGTISENCVELVNKSRDFVDGKKVLLKGAFDL